jgi:hypothetical protein
MALQLLQSGLSEAQLSGGLFQDILNQQSQQNNELTSAIGAFASNLSGVGGGGAGNYKLVPTGS